MEYIYIGKIVNTHALKGEVRIISNFEFKDKVFKVKNFLFVGENKEKLEIESYRKHKNFDMIKFIGIDYINDVLKYKGKNVYFIKEDLNLSKDEYLDSDIVGLEAIYNGKSIGVIESVEYSGTNKLLVFNKKLVPFHDNFIEKIDIENKKIILKNLEGLV